MDVLDALDRAAIDAVDPSGMLDDVLAQPGHLLDAGRRAAAAGLPRINAIGGLVLCGMGGSAIGGDLAVAALGDRLRRPLQVVRGYDPGPAARPGTLVVCASYSGNTEETLAAYEAARAAGAARFVVTTGGALAEAAAADGVPLLRLPEGLQPRAAVAYMLVAVLECAAACGAAPFLHDELAGASGLLAELCAEWGPGASSGCEAKLLARRLQGKVPVVYGAGSTSPVARRWKAQLNENAKMAAFWAELPEADHNEICAWRGDAPAPLCAMFLDDPSLDARLLRRVELTAQLIAERGAQVEITSARGDSPLERTLSLVLLGDLVSVYVAALDGVDPTPVDTIQQLKAALA
jgi:glucose/mannose-6-phosphate isomerase